MKKIYSLFVFLLAISSSWGQTTIFSENLGAPSGNTAISAYTGWQNNGVLTFTDGGATSPADIRTTSASTGYTGASGQGNVFFTGTAGERGFAIEGINASSYTSLSLQFGYRKENGSSLPTLDIDYWNGSAWVNLPFSFNEAASASVGWYLSPAISLPPGAQINGLKIRWLKTGSVSVRVDDIVLTGLTGGGPVLGLSGSISGFGNVGVGTASASQSIDVFGSNLTGAPGVITITSPSVNFEVSNDNSTWGGSTTITYSSSTLTATPLYVRFTPQSAASFNEDISLSGGGATALTVAVSGTGFIPAPAAPVATAATAITNNSFTANWNSVSGATGYKLDVYTLTAGTSVDTIAGWNFNVNHLGALSADMGNANNIINQVLTGSGIGAISNPAGPSGSSGTPNPYSASASGWDNGANTKYWEIGVNTLGASNILLSSLQGSSNTGPSAFKVQYKIGLGGTWTDIPGGTVTLTTAVMAGNLSTWGAITNLPLPAAADNQPQVFIRWISTSNDAVNGSPVASGGTSRISAIYVQGTVATQVPSYVPGYQDLSVGNVTSYNVTGLNPNTTYYYVVRAENAGGPSDNSNEESATTTNVVLPSLSGSTLTGFGNVCINTTDGPNSFTITGTNLTNADVTVAALAGFEFSTSATGPFSASLNIPQPGGAFSQTIYVNFNPIAVQSYGGDIVVGGGGASSINVAVTANGIDDAPTVTTGAASSITPNSADLAGTISDAGCSAVTAYGIEYSTTSGFANGTGTQVPSTNLSGTAFTSAVGGLASATTYYYKAYATNAGGTTYGNEQSFSTLSLAPTITVTSLAGFGNVCVNTTSTVINTFTINGSNLTNANVTVGSLAGFEFATLAGGPFSNTLSLTQPGGTFSQQVYVRFNPTVLQSYNGDIPVAGGGIASAVLVPATGAGVDDAPTVTTNAAAGITMTAATLNGVIADEGCSAITGYGFEYSTTNNFPTGSGTQVSASNLSGGNFSEGISGLTASTVYYFRAFATNAGGTSYGAQETFTTTAPPAAELNATTLAAFGNVCAGTGAGPNSFTLTGSNLTAANVTIAALPGYSFSTTATGTYTSTLSLTPASGSLNQEVFVWFNPSAAQSYNGNIQVSGGGASAISVPVSGTGIFTAPSVTTGNASNITTYSATLSGNLSDLGCSFAADHGFELSGISNFTPGNGTRHSLGAINSTGSFSVHLNNLVQGTTYYYRAYARNNSGIVYGDEQSFTVAAIANDLVLYPVPVMAGSELRFSRNNMKQGYTGIRIYNAAGQEVFRQNFNIQNNFINQTITIPSGLPTGIYSVRIGNDTEVLDSKQIIILN